MEGIIMLHKLETIEKDLQAYHDEMDGVSFGVSEHGQIKTHDYGDTIGVAIDAINDLIGVIKKGESE